MEQSHLMRENLKNFWSKKPKRDLHKSRATDQKLSLSPCFLRLGRGAENVESQSIQQGTNSRLTSRRAGVEFGLLMPF